MHHKTPICHCSPRISQLMEEVAVIPIPTNLTVEPVRNVAYSLDGNIAACTIRTISIFNPNGTLLKTHEAPY